MVEKIFHIIKWDTKFFGSFRDEKLFYAIAVKLIEYFQNKIFCVDKIWVYLDNKTTEIL